MTEEFIASWDCSNEYLIINGDITQQIDNIDSTSSIEVNGYIIYRYNDDGTATAIFKNDVNSTAIIEQNVNPNEAQPLMISLFDDVSASKAFQWNSLQLTTFIDWFSPPQSDIWTTYPSSTAQMYISSLFSDIDIDPMLYNGSKYYIEFTGSDTLASDSTKFQFISKVSY